jgi:aminopeptidase
MIHQAQKVVREIVDSAFAWSGQNAVVIWDQGSDLAPILGQAYTQVLAEKAQSFVLEEHSKEELLEKIFALAEGDLVVLIQSENFRLSPFRLRVELFKRGFQVIEHLHLNRHEGVEQEHYLEALSYDPVYYRTIGPELKGILDEASHLRVKSLNGALLELESPQGEKIFEAASMNIGDYREMTNVGGLFPIGEVFTEARDLTLLSGTVDLFAYADPQFCVSWPDRPIRLVIQGGQVVQVENETPDFAAILDRIREDEQVVWVREIGLGLNRAFSSRNRVRDAATYERVQGMHLSLGAKHSVYPKPGLSRRQARHHVDVFVDLASFEVDQKNLWLDNAWKSRAF